MALNSASDVSSDNPDIQKSMALIQILRSEYSRENLVLAPFRRSAELRTADPEIWALLAWAKSMRGELDTELTTALRMAVDLGRQEPRVQYWVVVAGLSAWRQLDPESRNLIVEMAVSGIRNRSSGQTSRIVDVLRRFDMLDVICVHLQRDDKYSYYCNGP